MACRGNGVCDEFDFYSYPFDYCLFHVFFHIFRGLRLPFRLRLSTYGTAYIMSRDFAHCWWLCPGISPFTTHSEYLFCHDATKKVRSEKAYNLAVKSGLGLQCGPDW